MNKSKYKGEISIVLKKGADYVNGKCNWWYWNNFNFYFDANCNVFDS